MKPPLYLRRLALALRGRDLPPPYPEAPEALQWKIATAVRNDIYRRMLDDDQFLHSVGRLYHDSVVSLRKENGWRCLLELSGAEQDSARQHLQDLSDASIWDRERWPMPPLPEPRR